MLFTIGATIAGIGVIALRKDVLAVRRGIAIGVFGVIAGVAAAAWPAFTLSEMAPGGLHNDQENTFVLFLVTLGRGAILL